MSHRSPLHVPCAVPIVRAIRMIGAAGALALLAACAQTPGRDSGEPRPAKPMACNAEAAGAAIGKAPDAAVVEQARRDAGAASTRVLRPGDTATMDYRQDRLNVMVGGDGRIETLRCG